MNFFMVITSRANPFIKKIIRLNEKKFRREYGEYLVEGIKPVGECIAAGNRITAIVCTEDLSASYENAVVVSDDLFAVISSEKTPQGVLAVVALPSTSVSSPRGNCLLLDRLQDPGNLGTILRTANAAGYEDVYLLNCTDAFAPKAVRASMSGIFFVNLHIGGFGEIMQALGDIPLITADMNGADVFSFRPPERFCLCIGNEGSGISDEVRSRSAYSVKIPMRKTCESLNAAISAAVTMYALKNQER